MAVLREVKDHTGVVTTKKSSGNSVIVMDQKDEAVRKTEAANVRSLAELLRNTKFNVSRCILAIHDPEASSVYNIPAKDNRSFAMIEVFNKNGADDKDLALEVQKVTGFLVANKYKVLATKTFKKEYLVCKLIVKCIDANQN